MNELNLKSIDWGQLKLDIRDWAMALGFDDLGVSGIDLEEDAKKLWAWINANKHGDMEWMKTHGDKRTHPQKLIANTLSIISVRLNYWPQKSGLVGKHECLTDLENPNIAYIARYAMGKDYHSIIRKKLQRLADRITAEIGPFAYRAFSDSAPVLEKPIARNAGLGWIGKHTNLIDKENGSYFFLGELYTNLPLIADESAQQQDLCGSCNACINVCPTNAITAPYQLDARKCIAYLTIEHKGAIPIEFREQIGNRIFGCDDCQLFCPWNKYASSSKELAFVAKEHWKSATLLDLFAWSEETYMQKTVASPLRRLGYQRFLRNIAIALGNAPKNKNTLSALERHRHHPSLLVREHVLWAIERQQSKT